MPEKYISENATWSFAKAPRLDLGAGPEWEAKRADGKDREGRTAAAGWLPYKQDPGPRAGDLSGSALWPLRYLA